jgi:hypothetical protein
MPFFGLSVTMECSLLICIYDISYKNKLTLQQWGIGCHLNVAAEANHTPFNDDFRVLNAMTFHLFVFDFLPAVICFRLW